MVCHLVTRIFVGDALLPADRLISHLSVHARFTCIVQDIFRRLLHAHTHTHTHVDNSLEMVGGVMCAVR